METFINLKSFFGCHYSENVLAIIIPCLTLNVNACTLLPQIRRDEVYLYLNLRVYYCMIQCKHFKQIMADVHQR